jgi:hypothetical protein
MSALLDAFVAGLICGALLALLIVFRKPIAAQVREFLDDVSGSKIRGDDD